MNKPLVYSLLIAFVILTLSLSAMHSGADFDLQWGQYHHFRLRAGEVKEAE